MAKMNTMQWTSFVLLVVGALNWGLVGFFGYNLVDSLLGAGSVAARVVYDLVGLGALYALYDMYKMM